MTEQPRAFSDDILTAFLDGEAAADDARAIEAALEQEDAELIDRLTALDIPKLAIADAFDSLLADAPPMPDLPPMLRDQTHQHVMPDVTPAEDSVVVPIAGRKARRWIGPSLGLGTGIAAGIAMTLGFGWSLQTPAPPPGPKGWIATVAQYQMLYTPQTLAATAPGEVASLAQVSEAVGLDLTQLANIDGLTFHRAQELGFNGKALIQIAYTLPDGTPFAICILRNTNPAGDKRFQVVEGMQTADWNTGTHGVLLIGGQDAEAVQALVPKVEALL